MPSQEYWERRRKAVEEQLQQYTEETTSNKFQVPIPQLQKFFAKKQEAKEETAQKSGASVLKIFGIIGAVLVVFLLVLSIWSGNFSQITGLASSELPQELGEEAQEQGQQESFTKKIRDLFVVEIPVP